MVEPQSSAAPLTRRSATDLAQAIRVGEVTSREVVEEHIELVRRTAPDVNAIACERFDQARAEADAADERVRDAAAGDQLPPLLEVPLLGSTSQTPLQVRRMAIRAAARRGPHTRATAILVITEKLGGRMPPGRTRRAIEAGHALSREVEGVLGDGVMLHPPFPRPAPRHGRTVGRPWMLSHAAVFNLLGLPVTQVPLGIGREGLPLGVQVATARDADHRAIAVAQALERSLGGWVAPR